MKNKKSKISAPQECVPRNAQNTRESTESTTIRISGSFSVSLFSPHPSPAHSLLFSSTHRRKDRPENKTQKFDDFAQNGSKQSPFSSVSKLQLLHEFLNFFFTDTQISASSRGSNSKFRRKHNFSRTKIWSKIKTFMIFHTFSSLTPLFFSRTSVEFYEISMRPGTPPQRGALMAALTRRFNHFCRNEYGFIEAESDQISPTSTRKRSKF